MTDEQLEAIKAEHGSKHGKLLLVTAPSGAEVVLRRPKRMEWKRFQTQGMDDDRRSDAADNLLTSCVVHPDKAQFAAMLDEEPGLATTFTKQLLEFAGAVKEGVEKKVL